MSQIDAVINSSVKNLVEFIRQKVQNNIAEANSRGMISLNDGEVDKIVNLVDSSVTQALALGYSDVESAINTLKKEYSLQ
ncbi:hypothetical protein CMI47_11505 [Candidatus Pacearchaeota archaeon]|nr:hypothetical protein [Candidatus Pacearchaeota archaeon]